ncbi:meiosis 1 arrest protein [Petromyzon marinus]|uniref:meiosis 1 arrest protein n=1 Tax=Petromyzon marinus TaxID=7757 RepID=UPI003F722639
MSSAAEVTHRTAFSRQPCRCIIVDCTPPFGTDSCELLCHSLDGLFSVACHLGGPCRIPLFSLYIVHGTFECLLPFVQVKGGHARMQECLRELRSLARVAPVDHRVDGLQGALQDALANFRHQLLQLRQSGGLKRCMLEVTVVTWSGRANIIRLLHSCLPSAELDCLKRVQVVRVDLVRADLGEQGLALREDTSEDSLRSEMMPSPSALSATDDGSLSSLIDVQTLEGSTVVLEGFFRSWLHDCETDWEHLHLILPSALSGGGIMGQKRITLKCDIQETILNPPLLPGTTNFTLNIEGSALKRIPPMTGKSSSAALVPIHHLKAVSTVSEEGVCESVLYGLPLILKAVAGFEPSNPCCLAQWLRLCKLAILAEVCSTVSEEGVCESVLYGLPLILKPTSCWKLDWEELETNRQYFHALSHSLKVRGQQLLASCDSESSGPLRMGPVRAYYLLLPSGGLSLLIKSIAVAELLLPCDQPLLPETPELGALLDIETALSGLEVLHTYNPLHVHSGLSRHHVRPLTHGSSGSRAPSGTRAKATGRKPMTLTATVSPLQKPLPRLQFSTSSTAAAARSAPPPSKRLRPTLADSTLRGGGGGGGYGGSGDTWHYNIEEEDVFL